MALKWVLIFGLGGLLLGLFRLLLDCVQANWTIRLGDSAYGIHAVKSFVFLVLGIRSVEVSAVIDYAAIVMPIMGLAVGGGIWILRKFRHAGV